MKENAIVLGTFSLTTVDPLPNTNVQNHMIWWKQPSETAPGLKETWSFEIRVKELLLSTALDDKIQKLKQKVKLTLFSYACQKHNSVSTKSDSTFPWSLITHLWVWLSTQTILHSAKYIVTIADLILRSHGGNPSFIPLDLLELQRDKWAHQNYSLLAAINKRYIQIGEHFPIT